MGELTGYFIFWVAVFLLFAVAEALTIRLISIWFAVGSLCAFVTALIGTPFWLQLVVFFSCSILMLLLTVPFSRKITVPGYSAVLSGNIIGKTGIVTEEISSRNPYGKISVNGLDCAAQSADGHSFFVGETVMICAIDGIKVKVKSPVSQL